MKRFLMIFLIVAIMLSGCTFAGSNVNYKGVTINMYQGEGAIKNLTVSYSKKNEVSSQNPFNNSYASDIGLAVNIYEGLVGTDENNNIVPAVATSWEASDDYKTWTFHLRDDACWVNVKGEVQAQVTSDDFITGLEWCLNFTKNQGTLYSLATTYVEGAQEYFDYTSALSEEEGWNLSRETFLSMVGIEAPDPYTIVYKCIEPCAYFPTLLEYVEFLPASAEHIADVGIENFRINYFTDAWFNGPYILTEFVPGNERIIEANPNWRGNDENTRFMSVTFKCVENSSIEYQLYRNNEIDQVTLSQSLIKSIQSDESSPYRDKMVATAKASFAYQFYFNFCKKDEDGNLDDNWNKAVSNKAFRLSWYYGLDLFDILKLYNSISPTECEGWTVTAPNLVKLSDGRDYVDVVADYLNITENDGNSLRRYDKELGEEYKQQAISELSALGVTFPVQVDYYVMASSQDDQNLAYVLKDCIEKCLGTDYVEVNIKTYTSSGISEVCVPGLQSIYKTGWGADYADPSSPLSALTYGDANAYLADTIMGINKWDAEDTAGDRSYITDLLEIFETYNEMYFEAAAINGDMDKRYEAMAQAESYLISEGIILPFLSERGWLLTKINVRHKCNSASSYSAYKYINMQTNSAGYTNDIWED